MIYYKIYLFPYLTIYVFQFLNLCYIRSYFYKRVSNQKHHEILATRIKVKT